MRGNIFNWLFSAVFLVAACQQFEFDPNQSVSAHSADRLNYTNVERIISAPVKEELQFAVIGDSHLDYDNLIKTVNKINNDSSIDFVIHTGDITDHGLLKEYEWALGNLQKLNKPFVVTLGNHDLLSLGEDAYRHMYGNPNFTFIKDSVKFVFFNSNSREYDFNGKVPDMDWLSKELTGEADNYNKVILVSHVPFWDKDFDLGMKPSFISLLKKVNTHTPILALLNGHLHVPLVEQRNDVGLLQVLPGSSGNGSFVKLKINSSGLTHEKVFF